MNYPNLTKNLLAKILKLIRNLRLETERIKTLENEKERPHEKIGRS